jgi:hypothetical protein
MLSNQEHSLDDELRAIELQLSDLTPCKLSSDVLLRMEQALGQWCEHDERSDVRAGRPLNESDTNELEVHLSQISPAALPEDMLTRMSRAMDSWHQYVPVEEKVVPFGDTRMSSSSRFGGNMWTAAAAVAVLGAVTALVMPRFSSPQGSAVVAQKVLPSSSSMNSVVAKSSRMNGATLTSNFLSHKVTNTSDNGVVFSNDNTPHRCIRVDYIERIKGEDASGRQVEINTPGVDFLLIPVETN